MLDCSLQFQKSFHDFLGPCYIYGLCFFNREQPFTISGFMSL